MRNIRSGLIIKIVKQWNHLPGIVVGHPVSEWFKWEVNGHLPRIGRNSLES